MEIKLTNVDKSQELKLEPSILKGDKGDKGEKGDTGQNGIGIPSGGTEYEILTKIGDGDYEIGWRDVSSIPDFYNMISDFYVSNIWNDIEEIKQRLDNLEK